MRLFGRPVKLVIVLLAVVVLLIFLHYLGVLPPLEGALQRMFTPIQSRLYALGTTINNFYRYPAQRDVAAANQTLAAQVQALTVENAQLKTLLLEQTRQNQQVDFLAAEGLQAINAKVVGRRLEINQQSLIVGQGSADGVRVGAPVIVEHGILIGRVTAVGNHSAQVRLINDSLSSFGAMIQNEKQDRGVVVGDRGLSVKLELVPQGAILTIGDTVVTSGVEADVPRGLVIGQIEQVVAEPNDLFQQAFIKTLVDVDNLIVVSILKPQLDE